MECINCGSVQIRKCGKLDSGGQRYQCKSCRTRFSMWGAYDSYSDDFKQQVVNQYRHVWISARQVAQKFHISLSTLVKWSRDHIFWCQYCESNGKKTNAKKNSAFTLIELLVVIVIIGIVMWTTSGVSRSYVRDLDFKNKKEDLVWYYLINTSKVLSSNYINGKSFDHARVDFRIQTGWSQALSRNFISSEGTMIQQEVSLLLGQASIISTRIQQIITSGLSLEMYSYGDGCRARPLVSDVRSPNSDLLVYTGDVQIHLAYPGTTKRYCLAIQLQTCKMRDVSCR